MFLFNDQAGQAILASAGIMAGSGQPKQRYCCMAEKLVVHSSTGLNEMPWMAAQVNYSCFPARYLIRNGLFGLT
jgi:hypothetical protein